MKDGFKILDTERHIVEPVDLWTSRLSKEFVGRAPRFLEGSRVATEVAGKVMINGGEEIWQCVEPTSDYDHAREHNFSADSHLADMDREGIDAGLLFPTAGLYVIWHDDLDPELSGAICKAYNDWLAEFCDVDNDRLYGVAMLPLQDVNLALEEVERINRDYDFAGVFIRPNPLKKRQLYDAEYSPLWEKLSAYQLPVCIHSSPGSELPELGVRDITGLEWPDGVQRFVGPFARSAISFPLEIMGSVISMAGEVPLERNPELKVFFSSGGNGWLQFWIERMDDEWFHRGNDAVTRLRPGHHVERQCLISGYSFENVWPYLTHEFLDCLSWGSGYPHPMLDDFPNELDKMVGRNDLTSEQKRQILWDNPARVFGIE